MKPNLVHFLCGAISAVAVASAPAAGRSDESSGWVKHRPMEPYHNPDGTFRRLRGVVETTNWSGYAVTAGSPYTSASATWQVPNATYDGGATPYGYEYVFNWVGIGGDADATLIQLGTEFDRLHLRHRILLRLVRALSRQRQRNRADREAGRHRHGIAAMHRRMLPGPGPDLAAHDVGPNREIGLDAELPLPVEHGVGRMDHRAAVL